MNTTESTTTQEAAKEPVQVTKSPLPKTDSVETKTNSFYNFDNAPKVDSSKANLADQVPPAMIPGVPFREKVELAKTLPNGGSVDSGLAAGDLGLGKSRTGPNHMGIDMKGTEIRNQLEDALKLKGGSQETQSAPPSGKVNHTGLEPEKIDKTYDAGFKRPGMEKIADGPEAPLASPNPVGTLLNLPRIVEKVTGRAADFLDGVKALFHPEERVKKYEEAANEEKKYISPDADPITVNPEDAERALNARFGSNKTPAPGADENNGPIVVDGSKDVNPLHHPLVSDPAEGVLENTVIPNLASIDVIHNAEGPDTVNPNDPDSGGGEPIVIDPKN